MATEAALTATWTRTSLTKNEVVTPPLGFLHICSGQSTTGVDQNWEEGEGGVISSLWSVQRRTDQTKNVQRSINPNVW